MAEWPVPRRFGSIAIDFGAQLPSVVPEFGVLELENGHLFGKHGWVVAGDGTFLPELSWHGWPSERIRGPRRLPRAVRVRGTCLSLVSDWSSTNYAHFLLDGLGRLALYRGIAPSPPEVDYVVCPRPPSSAAASLFDRLGIPREKRIIADPGVVIRADALLVPSCPAHALTYQPWLSTFLRDAVLGSQHDGLATRRLYVSRSGASRQSSVEEELQHILVERSFELYDPSVAPSQPDDFDQAAVVIGAHGAGLANLVFCRPGTKVLELIPTDNAHPFYYSLALAGGLAYGYVAGSSERLRPVEDFGPSPYDFSLDLDAMKTALQEWLDVG